ncbi:iron ABC transporter substrate-binding protein [Deinococcus cellulosilyticus]|uniref:Iron ABC transporter substrate-binding protein n=1 Tax=Deinococcus cellulosilyticus (strain DSM 18568 / NBRC 106333 / KACC 11606 / 5516J-15) TaxID=1223518 RepID=A0A511NA39_DEIC1|nr:iron ABC transporter substrate-binding protein [Deinococcus cellulosilyticus]GEM49692.1 iron ABC transporter substrate-binding protein [Deinococcus cellulosilyticus NBRC 106333 = KACC 11606]
MKKMVVLTLAGLLAGAALAQSKSITVYTGRSKGLVDPIVQQFEKDTGIKVNVRYATDSAILAALQEEGKASPADLLWANSSGTLGIANEAGLLSTLSKSLVQKFPEAYAPNNNTWIPLSVRFRVMAYNTTKIKPEALPKSVMDLPKHPEFKGKVGWTPTYASFQDFVGAMIALKGEAATREWLLGMKALEPKSYAASNVAMMEGIRNGEIDIAITNHYYIQRFVKSGAPIGTHYFQAGDPGSLALVTGAGVLKTSKKRADALKFLNYLVGAKAQQFFTGELFEYPTANNTILPSTLLPFADAAKLSPKIDQEKFGPRLEQAQKLLREVGLL